MHIVIRFIIVYFAYNVRSTTNNELETKCRNELNQN